MKRLFCLIGKSGAGKDTVFGELLKRTSLIPVVTYTTRPMRSGETDGKEYHFVTDDVLKKLEIENKIIEKRTYHTVHGDWNYFTCDIDFSLGEHHVMIGTPEVVKNLVKYYDDDMVVIIYLELDDRKRLERCINRESEQKKPNYSEVCRRYLADEEDFSESEISSYKNLFRINSERSNEENVAECVKIIKSFK